MSNMGIICQFVLRSYFAFAVLSHASFAAINDLADTTVVRGRDTTLFCSNSEHTSGFAQWIDITDLSNHIPFASRSIGVLKDPPTFSKYMNFDLDTTVSTQLDLKISSAELEDEGTYACTLSPDTATATLTVEIEGAVPTITINGNSSKNPIVLRASEESALRCTARGFRPAVSLEWYRNNVQMTTGVAQDAATPNGDGTFNTSGTLTLTPTRQDNEAILECRTTGQVAAPVKTASLTLNVQYVPVVSVGYTNGVITCSSDANPMATNHKIILNGTNVVKEFTTSQGSHLYTPADGCTVISCSVASTAGTGTASFPEAVCPGYVEPQPMTTDPA